MQRALQVLSLVGAAILITGCGGSGLTPLTGTVKVDGAPLTGATGAVLFTPVGGGPTAGGGIKADGTYTVTSGSQAGLAPGEYLISVSASKPANPHNTEVAEIPKPMIPVRYADPKTSELKVTISSGTKTHDIDLKSK